MLHAKFIEANLSFRKFPNNHLIGEAAALGALEEHGVARHRLEGTHGAVCPRGADAYRHGTVPDLDQDGAVAGSGGGQRVIAAGSDRHDAIRWLNHITRAADQQGHFGVADRH